MSYVRDHHMRTCRSFQPILNLSLDGVQESKSSSISADVYSVSFQGCRTVYPIRIIRPINKFKIDEQKHLRIVIEDIRNSNCSIRTATFDNPK